MIDTIRLRPEKVEVESNADLSVQPATTRINSLDSHHGYPLFSTTKGRTVYGSKAFYNDPEHKIRFDISRKGPFVHFSVPGIYHQGCNYSPVDQKGYQSVVDFANSQLEMAGIHTDLRNAKLSRVDLFKNIITDHPFSLYDPLFVVLHAKRMYTRRFGSTYVFRTGERQIVIYDKIQELRSRRIDTSHLPDQVMRIEYRMMKGRRCRQDLSAETARGLAARWPDLPDIYTSRLKEVLFRDQVKSK